MDEEVTSLRDMLAILGTLSDDSLATPLTKAIQGFLRKCPDASANEMKQFLSELRDLAVYTGGANSFVMGVFWSILGDDRQYPPPCGGDPDKIGDWVAQWERDSSPIENFYRGIGRDKSGRTLTETLALPDVSLEAVHDWVQWVFPLPEFSQAQPNSPVLTPQDLVRFREDNDLRARVLEGLERFQAFLRATETRWIRPTDHNHLRISRVLRFLTIIGLHEHAHQLYRYAGGQMAAAKVLRERTDWYWRTALKPTGEAWPPEWAQWAALDSQSLTGKEE